MPENLKVEDHLLTSRLRHKTLISKGYGAPMAGPGAMMPETSGPQVLEKLKAGPETKAIPVVMAAKRAAAQDAETALSYGAIQCIIESKHEPSGITDGEKRSQASCTRGKVPDKDE